jgi:hypothetical protein
MSNATSNPTDQRSVPQIIADTKQAITARRDQQIAAIGQK